MDKLQEAQELEKKAQQLRQEAREEERKNEWKTKEEFEKVMNMDIYTSDDYCGLEVDKYKFYYGYEETFCIQHGTKCPDYCDDQEWAFTAEVDGKEVLRLPKSKVHPTKNEEPFWYLVAGIGHFLKIKVS
jgi:hypothetical protein